MNFVLNNLAIYANLYLNEIIINLKNDNVANNHDN